MIAVMATVLVVEDDRYIADAYKVALEKAGFELKLASDGVEAMKLLGDWVPNIIVLDLVMPRKDGYATLEEIKASDRLKRISVLVVSNLGSPKDVERAMKLGASKYIIKSQTSPSHIVSQIRSIIG